MLDDYFNLCDKKDTKDYYLSLSVSQEDNKLVVGCLPESLKPRDKLINKR